MQINTGRHSCSDEDQIRILKYPIHLEMKCTQWILMLLNAEEEKLIGI